MGNNNHIISTNLNDIITSMLSNQTFKANLAMNSFLDKAIWEWLIEDIDEQIVNVHRCLCEAHSSKLILHQEYTVSPSLSDVGITKSICNKGINFSRNGVTLALTHTRLKQLGIANITLPNGSNHKLKYSCCISNIICKNKKEVTTPILIKLFDRIEIIISHIEECKSRARAHEESRRKMMAQIDQAIQHQMISWWESGSRFRFYLQHSSRLDLTCDLYLKFFGIPQPIVINFQYETFEESIKELRTKVETICKPMHELQTILHKELDVRILQSPSCEYSNLRGKWWLPEAINRQITLNDLRIKEF